MTFVCSRNCYIDFESFTVLPRRVAEVAKPSKLLILLPGGAKSRQVPQCKYILSDSEWQSARPLDCLGDTHQSKPIKAYCCDDTNPSHPCQVKFEMRESWPKKCKKVDISGFLGVKKRHTFGKSSIAPKQPAPSLQHRGHSTTVYQGTI